MKIVSNTPGNPHAVIQNLHRARNARARGVVATDSNGKPIRVGIVYLGGVMSAALGAEVGHTLYKAELSQASVVQFGLSAGAITAAANVTHLSHTVGPEYERLADERFVSLFRVRNPLDFCRLYETLHRVFGNESFENASAEVYSVATDMHKRKGALLDIKKNKLKAILASMAIPGYQMPVKIGEGYFIDGGWCPLPMSEIILRFRLTDVLIVANRPTAREESTFEYMLDWYTGADTSLDTALERMQKLKRTRVLAILPTQETAIPRLLADAKTIRKSTAVAARFMEDILDEAYVG